MKIPNDDSLAALSSTCTHNVVRLSFGNMFVSNQMISDKKLCMRHFGVPHKMKIKPDAPLCSVCFEPHLLLSTLNNTSLSMIDFRLMQEKKKTS